MRIRSYFAAAVAVIMTFGSSASAQAAAKRDTFVRDFGAFLDRLLEPPYAPPGVVVLAFDDRQIVFERAYGVRDVRTNAPLTPDTPIYNASLTKAYTGVLAAQLDAAGILPISTRLTDIWPRMRLRPPFDPAKVTMGALLSHSSRLYDEALEYQSNTTGEVDRARIAEHVSRHAVAALAFQYSNFGPFLYSTIAALKSGESWHQGIRNRVLKPLALNATVTRIEDAPTGTLAHCHSFRAGRWNAVPLKPTPILNAAGGMYASGRDTAKFMIAMASDSRSAGGRIPAPILRRTWQRQAAQDVNFHGMQRDSYGLGWDLGAYEGERYVSRSGGFTGCRSYALFMPERKFGVIVLNIGDLAGNTFNVALLQQAMDLAMGRAEAAARGAARIAQFRAAAKAQAERMATPDPRIAAPPPLDPVIGRAAPGTYANAAYGRFVISNEGGKLVLRAGALESDLVPLANGEFLAIRRGHYDLEPFKLLLAADGSVKAFEWQNARFARTGFVRMKPFRCPDCL